MRQPS